MPLLEKPAPDQFLPPELKQANARFTRPDIVSEPLYAVIVTFNPERSRNLMKYPVDFAEYMTHAGAIVYHGEVSFGERAEVYKEQQVNDRYIKIHIRTTHQLWMKENAQNVVASFLPADAKYIAFIDPDVRFSRPDIVGETIQQLQHFDVVQMFRAAFDLDKNYERFSISYGFAHDWITGYWDEVNAEKATKALAKKQGKREINKYGDYEYYEIKKGKVNRFHTGYAWAYRRSALDALGGLFDYGILGSGDNHMAKCLIGEWERSVNPNVTQEYKDEIMRWQDRALKYIKMNIGYVKGDLDHYWHGAKSTRGYKDRWMVLVNNAFNPRTDIKKDINGLWQLVVETPRQIKLHREIREYFRSRDDDGTDMKGIKPFWL